jgi:hypothetical protein
MGRVSVAQQVQVTYVDDLDGGPADQTVHFSLDGKGYEIDLSDAHAADLRDVLAQYIAAARRAGRSGSRARPAAQSTAGDRERNRAIREWARSQGMEISDRGRIPSDLTEAYDKAG